MVKPQLEAIIEFLTTEAGGRMGPVKTGYRPNHNFQLEAGLIDAAHEYIDVEWVKPGEKVKALLFFPNPQFLSGRLYTGFEFKVQEGGRVVGYGRVTKVLEKDLERAV